MEEKTIARDEILRATVFSSEAAVYLARTTELCEKARETHHASPLAAAVLGRTLTMTAIMAFSSFKNEDDRLTVTLNGNGLIGKVVCCGMPPVDVKGYVEDPNLDLPLNEKGKLDVGWAVGNSGTLTVIKDLGLKEPYVGRSALQTGEIAEDFAFYYTVSEQTPSLVALGVHVHPDLHVDGAGGILIQTLPGCSDETITRLEQVGANLSSISTMMMEHETLDEIMQMLFGGEFRILQRDVPRFRCDCSRDRIDRVLIAMGYEELKKMRDEDNGADLWCNFCNTTYHYTGEQLDALLEIMRR